MNNETHTIEDRPDYLDVSPLPRPTEHDPTDEELHWLGVRMLALLDIEPPASGMSNPRQVVLYASNRYSGREQRRFTHLCRGLYQMADRDFRTALREFDVVLEGRVDPDFEPLRELALECHAFCLQELDFDDEALDEFTDLLMRKFEETRESGEADHVAELLGLTRMSRRR